MKFKVLNLVINGIPSIPSSDSSNRNICNVLNLVINGIPSILEALNELRKAAGKEF